MDLNIGFSNYDEPESLPATADEFDVIGVENVVGQAMATAAEQLVADLRLEITTFDHTVNSAGQDCWKNVGTRRAAAWSELCQEFEYPKVRPRKGMQPLISFAVRAGNSKKAGANALTVGAVFGDYDAGTVSIDEAAARLRDAGVMACLFTTASHTWQEPRWRVVAPFSGALSPNEYQGMADALNGALGGILAPESWDVTRNYFCGRVLGVEYRFERVSGEPLDALMLAGLDWKPIGKPGREPRATEVNGAPRVDARQVADDRQLDRAIALDRVTPETIADLRSAVGAFSADDADDYHVWASEVGMGLASLKGTEHEDDARELFHDFSSKSPRYDHEETERKWASFSNTRSTYLKIFALAKDRGWRNPLKAVLETERERSSRIGREGEHTVPTQRVMTGSEMLEELVFIAEGSRVAFIGEPRFALPFGEFRHFTAASLELVQGHRGAKRKTSRAALWLESADRKTVRTQTFAPGRARICQSPDDELALNFWVPRSAAVPDNWREIAQPFFDHVAYLVPREAERVRFLDWLAHIEQTPGVLPHTHYLLVTRQTGIGRNWLAYALARVFAGYTALGFDLAESLRSGFNGALSQRLLAVVDELHEGGPGGTAKPLAEKLKSLLTEATRRVNPKYGRQHVEFNCCRFLMFSNHEAALPLADNDRRVVVIENPVERKSADYYAGLYRLLDEPGLGPALAEAFRRRDITGFNPGEVAPMSEAKAKTIRAGRSELEQAVRDIASDWPADCITSGRLHGAVADTVGGRVASTQGVAVAAGLVKYPRRVKVAGVAQHVWILRNASCWAHEEPAKVAAEVVRGDGITGAEDFA